MSEILPTAEIVPTSIIQKERVVFQMYDSYYNILNKEFNDFLRGNYLDKNLDIYLDQNNSARCPEILDSASAEIKTFPLQEQQKFIKEYIIKQPHLEAY